MFRVRFTPGLFKQNYRSPKKRINSLFKFFSEAITEANKHKHPPFFGICFNQTRHLGSENLKGNSKLRENGDILLHGIWNSLGRGGTIGAEQNEQGSNRHLLRFHLL